MLSSVINSLSGSHTYLQRRRKEEEGGHVPRKCPYWHVLEVFWLTHYCNNCYWLQHICTLQLLVLGPTPPPRLCHWTPLGDFRPLNPCIVHLRSKFLDTFADYQIQHKTLQQLMALTVLTKWPWTLTLTSQKLSSVGNVIFSLECFTSTSFNAKSETGLENGLIGSRYSYLVYRRNLPNSVTLNV